MAGQTQEYPAVSPIARLTRWGLALITHRHQLSTACAGMTQIDQDEVSVLTITPWYESAETAQQYQHADDASKYRSIGFAVTFFVVLPRHYSQLLFSAVNAILSVEEQYFSYIILIAGIHQWWHNLITLQEYLERSRVTRSQSRQFS